MEKTTLADKYLTFSEESKKLLPQKAVELLIDTFNKVYADICDFFNNGELLNVIITAKPEHGILPCQFVLLISKTDYGVEVAKWEEQHIEFSSYDGIFHKEPYDIDFITHELVHVAQNSKYEYPMWINEGLADYGRAKFGLNNEKTGWKLSKQISNNRTYKMGYGIAADLFTWIEKHIDETLPKHLNNTIKSGKYNDNYFIEKTGKTPDELWQMYLDDNRAYAITWLEKHIGEPLPKNMYDKIKAGDLDDDLDNYLIEKIGREIGDIWEIYEYAR
jgi:hypothetical protein